MTSLRPISVGAYIFALESLNAFHRQSRMPLGIRCGLPNPKRFYYANGVCRIRRVPEVIILGIIISFHVISSSLGSKGVPAIGRSRQTNYSL